MSLSDFYFILVEILGSNSLVSGPDFSHFKRRGKDHDFTVHVDSCPRIHSSDQKMPKLQEERDIIMNRTIDTHPRNPGYDSQ